MNAIEITNVAQLADLPEKSVLIGGDGTAWVRTCRDSQPWASVTRGGYGSSVPNLQDASRRLLSYEGPLTLVWTP